MNPSGRFPLFQTPVDLAHAYWKQLLQPGDKVVDATCGNGHDTLLLAHLVLQKEGKGWIWVIDTQQQALTATQERIGGTVPKEFQKNISYCHQSHASFPKAVKQLSLSP